MQALGFQFISGLYKGLILPLPSEGELLIGRSEELDLVFAEDMVSRKHAKIQISATGLSITDLGSTNGIYVNGEEVRRTELNQYDRVLIGTSIIKIVPLEESEIDQGLFDIDTRKAQMELVSQTNRDTIFQPYAIEEIPLLDTLQLLLTSQKVGTLRIEAEELSGNIFVATGQILEATISNDTIKGEDAASALLRLQRGNYRFTKEPTPEDIHQDHALTITRMVDLAREHLDLLPASLPQEATEEIETLLTWSLPLVPKLSALSPSQLDTLQLILNYESPERAMKHAKTSPDEFEENLNVLLKRGYLEAIEADD